EHFLQVSAGSLHPPLRLQELAFEFGAIKTHEQLIGRHAVSLVDQHIAHAAANLRSNTDVACFQRARSYQRITAAAFPGERHAYTANQQYCEYDCNSLFHRVPRM